MTEMNQVIGLIGFAIILSVKEAFNSNGRAKLHKRIDKLDDKYTSQKLCDERSGNIDKNLIHIIKKVDKLLLKNGIKNDGKQ